MKKKNNLIFLLPLICFYFFSCSTKTNISDNQQKFNSYINSKKSPFFYAEKMVKTIPDYKNSSQYLFFKACLSLKTENFKKNLIKIQQIKKPHQRIKAYTIAINKYNALKRYDISIIFAKIANKELKKIILKEKRFSRKTGIICNNLFNASLMINDFVFFESQIKDFITLSTQLNFPNKELKTLLVAFKKYIVIYYKKENKISHDTLKFIETVCWNMKQEKIKSQPISAKLHICNIISPYFYNKYRQKAICLINLAEIYQEINQPQKIKPIYTELKNIWDYSLKNPHLGKSFEVYIPKFVEILYDSGYEKEAIEFGLSIPDIYPFKLPKSEKKTKSNYYYKKIKLQKYNKLGAAYKFKSIKNIIFSMYLKKGKEPTLKWIYTNINSKHQQLSLISEIFYNNDQIKEPSLASEILKFQSYIKTKKILDYSDLKEIYIPLLMYKYSQTLQKGDAYLNELLSIIDKVKDENNKATFLIKVAAALSHIDAKKSVQICQKGFETAFNLNSQNINEKLRLIQNLILIYHTNRSACIPLKYFNNKTLKMLNEISQYNNPNRQLAIKIDAAISIAKQLKLLKRIKSEEIFLDMALEYTSVLQNNSLKQSYLLSIFTEYAEAKFYKKAFDIFPLIDVEDSKKDYFIKKINSLFVYTRNSNKDWIFTDIDQDNIPDIFNPEVSASVLTNFI